MGDYNEEYNFDDCWGGAGCFVYGAILGCNRAPPQSSPSRYRIPRQQRFRCAGLRGIVPLQRWVLGPGRSLTPTPKQCCNAKAGLLFEAGLPILPTEGWLYRNDCVAVATLLEDLSLNPAPSHQRRFLATPLHEIIMGEV